MKDFTITEDNTSLSAVFHSARNKKALGTIVVSHGFRGSKDGGGRAILLAEKISDRFNVVRFDFSPLGTLTSQVRELTFVINWVRQSLGDKIILLGRSMGGCASLLAASREANMQGLILWSMPFDLKKTFTNALGKESIEKFCQGQAVELDDDWGRACLQPEFYHDLLAYDLSGSFSLLSGTPTLFVHGKADEVVGVEQVKTAFALAHEPKKLCLLEGADHRFTNYPEQSIKAVADWLDKQYG